MAVTKKKQQCRHLNLALKYSTFDFPTTPLTPGLAYWQANFTGLGCRTNRTLNFMAMDTVLHSSFAEHLGVDIFAMPHQTAAVIIEAAQESQYLLPEVNKLTLVEFIKNFTFGSLDRYLRSFPDRFYPSTSEEEMKGALCVQEVTTLTFDDVVLNNEKDVILMYYAPWCVFCHGISHVFLTVAKFFMQVEGLTFARINGDLNDLPWEFTVEKYPTIIFFPAHRKSESVEFPTSLPVTPSNLVLFVLGNADPAVRWKTAMQLCDGKCQTQNALQSDIKVQDLFLELKALRNQLQLLEDFLFNKAKNDLSKQLPSSLVATDSSSEWVSMKEYRNHLIDVLRDKKRKIRQARDLQRFLRQKHKPESDDVKKLIKDIVLPSDMAPRFDTKHRKMEARKEAVSISQAKDEREPFPDRYSNKDAEEPEAETTSQKRKDTNEKQSGKVIPTEVKEKSGKVVSQSGLGSEKTKTEGPSKTSQTADFIRQPKSAVFKSSRPKATVSKPNILMRDSKSKMPPDKNIKKVVRKSRDEL